MVALGAVGFYRGLSWFCRVLSGLRGFYRLVLVGFIGFYRALVGFGWLWWALGGLWWGLVGFGGF